MKLSDLQLRVLQIVHDSGRAKAEEIRPSLPGVVATALKRLAQRQLVRQLGEEGPWEATAAGCAVLAESRGAR